MADGWPSGPRRSRDCTTIGFYLLRTCTAAVPPYWPCKRKNRWLIGVDKSAFSSLILNILQKYWYHEIQEISRFLKTLMKLQYDDWKTAKIAWENDQFLCIFRNFAAGVAAKNVKIAETRLNSQIYQLNVDGIWWLDPQTRGNSIYFQLVVKRSSNSNIKIAKSQLEWQWCPTRPIWRHWCRASPQ